MISSSSDRERELGSGSTCRVTHNLLTTLLNFLSGFYRNRKLSTVLYIHDCVCKKEGTEKTHKKINLHTSSFFVSARFQDFKSSSHLISPSQLANTQHIVFQPYRSGCNLYDIVILRERERWGVAAHARSQIIYLREQALNNP
jgi:hypothetical protein